MMEAPDRMITVGRTSGTHGIRGHLKVHSYSGNLDSLVQCGTLRLSRAGSTSSHIIQDVRPHKGGFIIKLKGIDDISQAETLVGCDVLLAREQLPETGSDEYYWCDLMGLTVETVEGRLLGRVTDIFETGSSDIYVVTGTGREYLIPAIADVIDSIDLNGGKMVITPLEGLLDL